jgi:hypothetical protein
MLGYYWVLLDWDDRAVRRMRREKSFHARDRNWAYTPPFNRGAPRGRFLLAATFQ